MKKVISLLLCAAMLLSALATLSGCKRLKDDTVKNQFFSEDYLLSLFIPDLPVPPLYDARLDADTLYLNLTDDEFIGYSEAVAEYLLTCNGIHFPGIYHSSDVFGLFMIPMRYDYYSMLCYGYEINGSSNRFAYGRSDELFYTNTMQDYEIRGSVTLDIEREDGRLEGASFDYNTKITLREPSVSNVLMSEDSYYRYSMNKTLDIAYEDAEVVEYFGRYSGYCTAAAVSGAEGTALVETVGEYTFTYSEGRVLLIHYYDDRGLNDKIMSLTEAYEKEYIHDYEIKYVYEAFCAEK